MSWRWIFIWVLAPTLWAYPSFSFEQITNHHYRQIHYDVHGKPWLNIQGHSTLTQPSLSQTSLQTPSMRWRDTDGEWSLHAKQALFDHHHQTIEYQQQVVLTRKLPNQPTTIYRTQSLQADLNKRRITSNQLVTITQAERTVRTQGLTIQLPK